MICKKYHEGDKIIKVCSMSTEEGSHNFATNMKVKVGVLRPVQQPFQQIQAQVTNSNYFWTPCNCGVKEIDTVEPLLSDPLLSKFSII